MFSPPQNCLNMVALITLLIGKCNLIASRVNLAPKLTNATLETILNNQYDLFKSLLDLDEKATSVLSNESIFSS
jgi:hypothetical protein